MVSAWALTSVAPAWSQEKSDKSKRSAPPPGVKATARTHPNDPALWDVDAMMEEAVKQIARRYNLNADQEQYTRLLLTQRVRSFLDEHESEVRQLLQESAEMRTGLRPNDATAKMVWAARALPLYEEATRAILEGNEEWGDILDEQQKVTHDKDLKLMQSNFAAVTRTLKTWENPPNVTQVSDKPVVSDPGTGTTAPPSNRVMPVEDHWRAYVTIFIQAYSLDEKARNSARDKIHKEQYAKAKQYRDQKKDQFASVQKQLAELEKGRKGGDAQRDDERERRLEERQRELEQPIYELFVEMDRRLKALPTREQEASVDEAMKKQLDAYYEKLSGKREKAKEPNGTTAGASATAGSKEKPDNSDKPAGQPAGDTPKSPSGGEKPAEDADKTPPKPAEPDADDGGAQPGSDIPPPEKPSDRAA